MSSKLYMSRSGGESTNYVTEPERMLSNYVGRNVSRHYMSPPSYHCQPTPSSLFGSHFGNVSSWFIKFGLLCNRMCPFQVPVIPPYIDSKTNLIIISIQFTHMHKSKWTLQIPWALHCILHGWWQISGTWHYHSTLNYSKYGHLMVLYVN